MIALPYAPVVEDDGLELAGDGGELLAPEGRLPRKTADKDHRKPAAMPLVIEVAIANRDARHRARRSPVDGHA